MTKIKKIMIEKSRLIKFLLVGLSGTVVNLLIVWLGNTLFFKSFDDTYKSSLAIGLAIIISIFFNFLLNYFWTWKDKKLSGLLSFLIYLLKYYLTSLASAAIQFFIANGFILLFRSVVFSEQNLLPMEWKMGASFIGIAFASVINFIGNHYWTFGVAEKKESF